MAFGTKVGIKTTEKGTELQLMNLKGKEYLPVAQRLVWFRERYPEGSIQTELQQDGKKATARATIAIPVNSNYVVLATAHKIETEDSFPDGHAEKAETGAIGRALAMAGFGTQFETEFDEGDRIVDAPQEVKKTRPAASGRPSPVKGAGTKQASSVGTGDSSEPKASPQGNVANTNPELRVVTDAEAKPAADREDEAQYLGKLINAAAQEVVSIKRKATVEDLKQYLQTKYQVSSKNDLSTEQAKEFLDYLKGLSA